MAIAQSRMVGQCLTERLLWKKHTQDKVNTLIAKHLDKVTDLSKSQTKVILNQF